MDNDLINMDSLLLQEEVMKLRSAIRHHMEQKGHDRCWLDDAKLYSVLPEGDKADLILPCWEEFTTECRKYWENRQPNIKLGEL